MFFASFAFCVITFEPIMIQTCSAPQNDRLNFSFVKYTYVDGKKLARNGRKMALYYSASFTPHYRRVLISHLQSLICGIIYEKNEKILSFWQLNVDIPIQLKNCFCLLLDCLQYFLNFAHLIGSKIPILNLKPRGDSGLGVHL